jgi:hypothetical protein
MDIDLLSRFSAGLATALIDDEGCGYCCLVREESASQVAIEPVGAQRSTALT